jgi:hypothetical protein
LDKEKAQFWPFQLSRNADLHQLLISVLRF